MARFDLVRSRDIGPFKLNQTQPSPPGHLLETSFTGFMKRERERAKDWPTVCWAPFVAPAVTRVGHGCCRRRLQVWPNLQVPTWTVLRRAQHKREELASSHKGARTQQSHRQHIVCVCEPNLARLSYSLPHTPLLLLSLPAALTLKALLSLTGSSKLPLPNLLLPASAALSVTARSRLQRTSQRDDEADP